MVDVDASVNDVDINTLAASMIIFILGESADGELWAVADTRETLKKRLRRYESYSWRKEHMSILLTYPWGRGLDLLGPDNLVALNIVHFGHFANPLENSVRELASVALDMAVEHVTDSAITVPVGVLGMRCLEEVVVVIKSRQWHVLLQHDDIRVLDKSVRGFMLRRVKGGED